MNTLPFAQPSDRFSDGLVYRFRLRPLTRRRGTIGAVRGRPRTSSCSTASSPSRTDDGRPEGHVHDAGGRDGHVRRRRRARRLGRRRAGLRRAALGSVHHGRSGRAEDDRDRGARVHRPRRDLPGRQERPQPRASRSTADACSAALELVGRGRGDADPRQAQRPDRASRPARGEEPDAGAEAVRPGEPRPGDPRPLQHGGRLPPRRRLPGRLPGAAERQSRVLGRPRRQHRLADRRRRQAPADRARPRGLPRRRRHEAVRRAGLLPRDRAAHIAKGAHTRPAAGGPSTTT